MEPGSSGWRAASLLLSCGRHQFHDVKVGYNIYSPTINLFQELILKDKIFRTRQFTLLLYSGHLRKNLALSDLDPFKTS